MGSRHQNVIEINGKKYDAATGKMLRPAKTGGVSPVKNTGVIDGFVRAPKARSSALAAKPKTSRTKASHAAKSPQKSKTLMRSAVRKPKVSTAKPVSAIKKPTLKASPRRNAAAKQTTKSDMVTKFPQKAPNSVIKKVQHVPVVKRSRAPAHPPKQVLSSNKHVEAYAKAHRPTGKAAAKLIENALANATSHEQPHLKAKKSMKRGKLSRRFGISARAMSISTSALAIVMLAGFFAVQNVPNLSMRVASARAGFDATMPGYNPSGFSFNGPINYSSGQVTVSFGSHTDSREYTLTQKASNWSSEALRSNFINAEDKQYQTYVDRGRTLYIYDGSNATWVDDGIWYQVEGNSQMTTDQLVRIAASM